MLGSGTNQSRDLRRGNGADDESARSDPAGETKMFRAGLYARVSTNDQQTLAMQNRAMREYAARRGWTIGMQVREVNSGVARREAREKILEAARRREIDLVLVWRLDRWGRSVTDLLATLQELEHLGVGFVSITEALDLTTPAGRAIAAMLAVFAAFEREVLQERTRAGLAHAREPKERASAFMPTRRKGSGVGLLGHSARIRDCTLSTQEDVERSLAGTLR
jgi:putative DNA-invertase from lambdoid prophage Rac